MSTKNTQKIEERFAQHFAENGETFSVEEIQEMRANPPEKPDFPWIMFMAAAFKDALDIVIAVIETLALTGVLAAVAALGATLGTITSFIIATVIFVWMLNKGGGTVAKKQAIKKIASKGSREAIKKVLKKWGWATVIEFIPVLRFIPTWTILVFFTYHRDAKIVKLFWHATDVFGGNLETYDSSASFPRGGRSIFAKNERRGQQTAAHRREVARRRRSMDGISANRQRSSRRPSFNNGLANPSPFNGITQPLNA